MANPPSQEQTDRQLPDGAGIGPPSRSVRPRGRGIIQSFHREEANGVDLPTGPGSRRSSQGLQHRPRWLVLCDELTWPIVGMGLAALQQGMVNPELDDVPLLALLHFAHALLTSMDANREGRHSVAISLTRQCVETLTLVDLGLQSSAYRHPLLRAWRDGKITNGVLRQRLERDVWPSYGVGLWDEPWAEYFGHLAGAVQPYAHYTEELQGWQFVDIHTDFDRLESVTMFGLEGYDALKASRITLLHALSGWTLARLLLSHGRHPEVVDRAAMITAWGTALGSSKLLFRRQAWNVQLMPHMIFRGADAWVDE